MTSKQSQIAKHIRIQYNVNIYTHTKNQEKSQKAETGPHRLQISQLSDKF